jgi:MATE family multidrug resistance protein
MEELGWQGHSTQTTSVLAFAKAPPRGVTVDESNVNPAQEHPSDGRVKTVLELVHSITRLSLPMLLSYLGQASLTLVSTAFVGHWTDAETLAATGLGLALVNITGNALIVGFCSALDTLCANAYGSGQYRAVGLVAARGAFIQLLLVAPLVAVLWNVLAPTITSALVTPTASTAGSAYGGEVAASNQTVALATALCRWYTLALIPLILYEVLKRFLQAQGIVKPIIHVTLVAAAANVVFHLFFIPWMQWGIRGAALALALSQWVLLGTLLLVMHKWRLGEECWLVVGPSTTYEAMRTDAEARSTTPWPAQRSLTAEVCREWIPFLALALPGTAWVLVEWGAFEVTLFMAARLPLQPGDQSVADGVATQAVLMNAVYFCFMLPLSIHIGASVQVGNLVGAGRTAAARWTARVALVIAASAGIALAALLYSFRYRWPFLLTSNEHIANRVAEAALFVALFEIQDCLQYTSVGILKAIGKQRVGAMASFAGFWTASIPLAALFAFVFRLGVVGFWLGFALGELFLALFYICYIALAVDWEREVHQALARIAAST